MKPQKRISRHDVEKKHKIFLQNLRLRIEAVRKKQKVPPMPAMDEGVHRVLNVFFAKLQFTEACDVYDNTLVHLDGLSERTLDQIAQAHVCRLLFEEKGVFFEKCVAFIEKRFEQQAAVNEKEACYALQARVVELKSIAEQGGALQSRILIYVASTVKDIVLPILASYPIDYCRLRDMLFFLADGSIDVFGMIGQFAKLLLLSDETRGDVVKLKK